MKETKGLLLLEKCQSSLAEFLQTQVRAISYSLLLPIVFQTACAVAALHKQGWIHRDLKLENLLISHSGIIKLIDFGSATQDITKGLGLDRDKNRRETLQQDIDDHTTPFYRSPEQCDFFAQ